MSQIGPLIQGANRPSWTVTVKTTDNAPVVLTGATFTGCLYNAKSNHKTTLTTGNYAISDATNGIFTYAPTTTEVGGKGSWQWETAITISSQVYKVIVDVVILPALGA